MEDQRNPDRGMNGWMKQEREKERNREEEQGSQERHEGGLEESWKTLLELKLTSPSLFIHVHQMVTCQLGRNVIKSWKLAKLTFFQTREKASDSPVKEVKFVRYGNKPLDLRFTTKNMGCSL